MNLVEHLLTILGEEGSEITKETAKASRFGLEDRKTLDPFGPVNSPDNPTEKTNAEKIRDEFIDALTVYQMAANAGVVEDLQLKTYSELVRDAMHAKTVKVLSYMRYAARAGALQLPQDESDPLWPLAQQLGLNP